MKKYTIQDVYNILKKTDCTVTCFPYETAGVKFNDPVYDYDDNSYPRDDRLHDDLQNHEQRREHGLTDITPDMPG